MGAGAPLRQAPAALKDPVVFEEDPGTSSRFHPLQRPKFRDPLNYARPGDNVHTCETYRLMHGTGLVCRPQHGSSAPPEVWPFR